jgi:CDP-glucose 4,6-dehydratase
MEGLVTPAFWSGKRVLVTGHTGFKGAWLTHWLISMGAKVSGLALAPETDPALFDILRLADRMEAHRICDIRDVDATRTAVTEAAPEVVFHLAAQPIVRRAFRDPLESFATNVMGTAHVLDSLREMDVQAIVAITTDKVYDNQEWVWPYRETDHLGGHEPYGASKAACEMVLSAYRESYFRPKGTPLVAVRAGNVIGGGDWSEARLIPDVIAAFAGGTPLILRNPDAVRPWQHVLEPLAGYLRLAEQAASGDDTVNRAFNFGPDPADMRSVRNLVETAAAAWGTPCDVRIEPDPAIKESQLLTLDSQLVKANSGWRPTWDFDLGVAETIGWYRAHHDNRDMIAETDDQLARFVASAQT